MTFHLVHQPSASTNAQSPFRIVEQPTGREVTWINRFLDREWVRRLADTTLRSYALDLLHFARCSVDPVSASLVRAAVWWTLAPGGHAMSPPLESSELIRQEGFPWIRIIFRCWKERQPYDERTYLQSLQKRRSPLGPPITALGWKTVAGFQKFSGNPS